ncbi:hypothetical protein ASG32_08150 [Methylobacterium sp. Leaf361]|nr:hypothetical protein ASG32_08150 [Methylobacterium sp. Leaf361]
MGLRIRAADAPPVDDGVRRPTGRPAPARPGWEDFLVAVKPVGDPWPPAVRARIQQARARYEAGTHEMVTCTTKDGWTQLYSRPRRVPAGPRPYFTEARS